MRVERGASQVLFGMLPNQTVDLEGRVWRVARWADPPKLELDQTAVRKAILAGAAPWSVKDRDGGVAGELHALAPVEVVTVHKDRGVVVEQFPRQWRCRACGRLTHDRPQRCRCGSTSISQEQIVAFHNCGALQEPRLPECPTHRQVAVRRPAATASVREMRFFCPECHRVLSATGYPFQPCRCGDPRGMSRNVHRAGVVFSPQYAVLVNPPDPAESARIRATGGGARALEWVLGGLEGARPGEGQQTVEGFVESLVRQGLSEGTAREFAERALEKGEVSRGSMAGDIDLPQPTKARAEDEALNMASALALGRVQLPDMVENTTPPLRTLYETRYRQAIELAGLVGVELLTNFPVATLAFGFTRGGSDPNETTLVPFRERGGLRAYGTLTKTEALLFQLDPLAVHRYLAGLKFALDPAANRRDARLSILRHVDIPLPTDDTPQPLGAALLTLLHSYGHRLVRTAAVAAGIERDSLAEYLLPHHLGVVVYAASRGDFVLGGLQVLFEAALDRMLDDFVHGETRCPLDPGCRSGGGACMACLHLGEPSCRWFNRFLDRASVFGEHGFLVR